MVPHDLPPGAGTTVSRSSRKLCNRFGRRRIAFLLKRRTVKESSKHSRQRLVSSYRESLKEIEDLTQRIRMLIDRQLPKGTCVNLSTMYRCDGSIACSQSAIINLLHAINACASRSLSIALCSLCCGQIIPLPIRLHITKCIRFVTSKTKKRFS